MVSVKLRMGSPFVPSHNTWFFPSIPRLCENKYILLCSSYLPQWTIGSMNRRRGAPCAVRWVVYCTNPGAPVNNSLWEWHFLEFCSVHHVPIYSSPVGKVSSRPLDQQSTPTTYDRAWSVLSKCKVNKWMRMTEVRVAPSSGLGPQGTGTSKTWREGDRHGQCSNPRKSRGFWELRGRCPLPWGPSFALTGSQFSTCKAGA